jgi:L-alanine-DL-glutamate epimerase-like enolase superfamily enzyme
MYPADQEHRVEIGQVEVFPVAVPLTRPLRMAVATVHRRTCIVVRVTTDDGIQGIGEAVVARYFSGESLASAAELIGDVFAPELVGKDPSDLYLIRGLMRRIAVHNNAARAAVEMALHDIVARAAGMPLYQLYGGRSREAVPTIWHVSGGDPASNAEDAARAVTEDGYRLVKVKVGGDVDVDIAKVRAVRDAVGSDVTILPDANQGWDVASALRFCDGIADTEPGFVEQPLPHHDVLGMARVNAGPVPIAGDEGVFDAAALRTHLELGAVDAVVAKLMKGAGPIGVREVFAVADAAGIGVHFAGMAGQTSVGAAHAAHLAMAVPNLRYGAGICPYYLEGDIVAEPFVAVDGMLVPPAGPGLGLVLDDELVERYRVDV